MSSRRDLPSGRIPAAAGIGLRFPHHRQVAASPGALAWVEVHPENYMAGGAALGLLEAIRRDLPPLPYTEEALDLIWRHVEIVQGALRHRLLARGPSSASIDHLLARRLLGGK